MNRIALTGLTGNHPLASLAAFGLLRCCDELDGFHGARLGWAPEAGCCAVLETDGPANPVQLVAALASRQQGRPISPELNWSDSIKTAKAHYLQAAAAARQALTEGRRDFADFLTAFACELRTDDDGNLEPTAFYMTSGQQRFLKEARNLAQNLASCIRVARRAKKAEEMLTEALFGPWKYEDDQHSLGWDPTTECLWALRARSPSKRPHGGVTAAVWLAFEALPLFPCFLSGGRLVTTGFTTQGATRRERVTQLTWPIWTHPVPLDTVRSLLSLAELAAERPRLRELRARGIAAVFRAERYKVKTKGSYFILRSASPCT